MMESLPNKTASQHPCNCTERHTLSRQGTSSPINLREYFFSLLHSTFVDVHQNRWSEKFF